MPEGEKLGGDNLPSPVGIGLTDPANIGGGAVAPLSQCGDELSKLRPHFSNKVI